MMQAFHDRWRRRLQSVAICALIVGLTAPSALTAQGGRGDDVLLYSRPRLPIYIGIEGGYGSWRNEADFSVSDRNVACVTFTDGEGEGRVAGLKGIIYYTRWLFLSPRLRYEERSGSFLTPLPGEPARDANNEIVELALEGQVDVTMATLSLDLMIGIDIARTGIYIAGGPSGSLLANGFYDYTERLKGPEGFTYGSNGFKEQALVNGASFETYNRFAFDLRGGAGYLLRIGRWGINPELFYSYPLTSALAEPDLLKQTGVVATLGILYNFAK